MIDLFMDDKKYKWWQKTVVYQSLHEGLFDFIKLDNFNKKCIAYKRVHEKQAIYVYLNFSGKSVLLKKLIPNPKFIFSTISSRNELNVVNLDGYVKLRPFEGLIFE